MSSFQIYYCKQIIHRFYPCKLFLQRYKKDIDVSCSFCNNSLENLHHLFCSCHLSCAFWQKLCTSFPQKIDFNFTLSYEDVLFGSFTYNPAKSDQYYIINLIVLLAKYHIHKCKFSSQKPLFLVFVKELKQYLTIQRSQNKKAVKTTDLCLLFNSYWNAYSHLLILWPPITALLLIHVLFMYCLFCNEQLSIKINKFKLKI